MEKWAELDWESIYSEHCRIVQGTLKTDDRVKHLKEVYAKSVMKTIKNLCVKSLGELVDAFRADNPEKKEPNELDWAEFFWHYEKRKPIEKKLRSDKELKKTMAIHHKHDTTNISYAVSESYNKRINDRNNKSYSS